MMTRADSVAELSRSGNLDRNGHVFERLPNTAEEARVLKTLLKLGDQNVLTQARATEAKVKQLHGPAILHFATHGFFLNDKEMADFALEGVRLRSDRPLAPLSENPLLRSGLALAGANQRHSGKNDDGILTALEAAQLDLRGTELVVLSACDTGTGEIQSGEGVYGLRRAFVLAGAQTQIASLWKVSDDATKDLVVNYYERLLKGEGRSASLREVQKVMSDSSSLWHPYYWAAFVPIGNWTSMPARP
jgi:CHAT domain-containing protein